MSFLYPLFFLGALGIAAPIILHMIRRQTQKQQVFSSLMFLQESRPRYQKRSKIEHWLLLLLRCLALILLALAFVRPFWANPIEATPVNSLKRKVILVDTSASMRREGIWPEVLTRFDAVLGDVEVDDRVSVMTFDQQPGTLIDFEQWQLLEPDQRALIVGEQVKGLNPSWRGTALDQALIAAVRMIEEDEINTQSQTIGAQQIVLISDLQQGAELDLLHTFHWPGGIYLTAETVAAEQRTNGSLTVLADQNAYAASGEKSQRLVRVSNSADALQERFAVQWDNNPSESQADSLDVYVPPGQSVVVNIPYADESPQHLQLVGDDNPFDNQHYVSAPVRHQLHILFLGDEDVQDTQSLSFFLDRAFQPTRLFEPKITVHPADEPLTDIDLGEMGFVMIADDLVSENVTLLQDYLQTGKKVLVVMKTAAEAHTIAALTGKDRLVAEEVRPEDYAMLSEVDLNHPVLLPFDDPRFSDFTQIHFWNYRRLNLDETPGVRVIARFDSDDPAWFTVPAGEGQLVVMTSGWHPGDSQLALSTKFVPLIYSILEYGGALSNRPFQYTVGQPFQLPGWIRDSTSEMVLHRPDQTEITLEVEQDTYYVPDEPGFYAFESNEDKLLYAVNIAARESLTAPRTIEELETFGVSFQPQAAPPTDPDQQARQDRQSDCEQESRQKLWRWVLLALGMVLLLETALAGWLSRSKDQAQGV